MDIVYNISVILVLIGALNWGLIAIAQLDLVAAIFAGGVKFGNISTLSRIVYGLVGLAALYVAYVFFYNFI